ncbi:hypothetical protein [Streptomyces sp. RPT161]|uniref:hypothetical protein n=1 Tax=Streptomyces sp. RPT161 TaxID=3015993 RepID=UPI0022B85CAE|nr:hypothetical protein [Streptomyces sp. RPT161]
MTRIEEILSRALLVRDRTVPRDIIPSSTPATTPQANPAKPRQLNAAADELRALCETLVLHTPATTIDQFVTDQVPEPSSALILGCVLQLTDTDDGARFWWQYAAGAGQAVAAYCLYLHHLAQGESDAADWWHRQTDDAQPSPEPPTQQHHSSPESFCSWCPSQHRVTNSSTTTILRVLRHLAKSTTRPRSATVTELMDYVSTAVAIGYLHQPEMELPTPGPDFAHRISTLLAVAANCSDIPNSLPARLDPRRRAPRDTHQSTPRRPTTEPVRPQMGETATR